MRRRTWVLVIVLAVTGVTGACGDDRGSGGGTSIATEDSGRPADPRAELASASKALSGAGTAAFDLVYEFTDPAMPDVDGTGRVDLSAARSEFVLPIPQSEGVVLRLLQAGSVFYISLDGDRWAEMTIPGAIEGIEAAVSGGGANPADILGGMADATGLRSVGTEDVNGFDASHFQARIEGESLGAVFGPEGAAAFGGSGEPFIVYDAWVDDDNGLLRRIAVDYGGGTEVLMSMTWELRDHGVAPPIVLPEPDAIVLRETVSDVPAAMERALEFLVN